VQSTIGFLNLRRIEVDRRRAHRLVSSLFLEIACTDESVHKVEQAMGLALAPRTGAQTLSGNDSWWFTKVTGTMLKREHWMTTLAVFFPRHSTAARAF